MKKINLIDCTLRDGGYYNNWDFSKELVQDYLNSLSKSGVKFIELGFRSMIDNKYLGPCAFTKDSFVNSLRIPTNLKIGIMINASEILSRNMNKKNFINFVLENNKSKLSFIRFACHYHEINNILKYINYLKAKDLKIIINLMQITERTDKEIESISKTISKSCAEVLYFADSMGGLNQNKIKKIVSLIKKNWKKEIGFHAHDNMGKALVNAETAIENGVEWIDSTITGMGRGPGNVKTEYALIQFKSFLKNKVELSPILNLIDRQFKSLQEKYKWGSNVYYFLSGIYSIHPTFIQSMLGDLKLKPEEMLSIIENLKKNKSTKYNKNLIEIGKQIYKGKTSGNWSPNKMIKNKEILIIGSGPGSTNHSEAIERFITKKRPFVIALNDQKTIDEKFINIRVACHTLRLASDLKNFNQIKQPLVLPLKRLSKNEVKNIKKVKILDFGLEIKPGLFKFNKNSAIMPNSLTICYALSIANSAKAKKIYLSGLDGYPIEDPRRIEMDEVLKLYFSKKNVADLISITPTRYKLKSISVYAH